MTGVWAFTVVILLVALERLAELVVSNRNAAWSLERGGRETGQGHYPFMVVLHTGLLVRLGAELTGERTSLGRRLGDDLLCLLAGGLRYLAGLLAGRARDLGRGVLGGAGDLRG